MRTFLSKHAARFRGLDLVIITLALATLFGSVPLASVLQQAPGGAWASARPAPDFELFDAAGAPRSIEDFRGRSLFLMFGYLRCADICHSQVANLVALANQLQQSDATFLYLAMDRRDDPAALRDYFDRRGQDFVSLHARDTTTMQAVANDYLAAYRIDGNPAGDEYDIEHPARIFLIDPAGQIRRVYNGSNPDLQRIAADFYQLNSASGG